MIYSGFAGIGKTYAAKTNKNVIDLESSQYQWQNADSKSIESAKGNYTKKNPNWPKNYINEIITKNNQKYIVLISAQPIILHELEKKKIEFNTVTPEIDDKEIYLDRYKNRGNSKEFVSLMSKNFERFVNDLDTNKAAKKHIKLHTNKFISGLFNETNNKNISLTSQLDL
jgi:hypothetical protein